MAQKIRTSAFADMLRLITLVSVLICSLVVLANDLPNNADDLIAFEAPELSRRYHALIDELRCPKCQNQNLADSDAPIAADLKNELVRLLHEGKSDQEILSFMQTRYGNFVLYRPPLEINTVILWLLPVSLLLGGVIVVFRLVLPRRLMVDAKSTLDAGPVVDGDSGVTGVGMESVDARVNSNTDSVEIDQQVDALLSQHPDHSRGVG